MGEIGKEDLEKIWQSISTMKTDLAVLVTKFDAMAEKYGELLVKYETHLDSTNKIKQSEKNRTTSIRVAVIGGLFAIGAAVIVLFATR